MVTGRQIGGYQILEELGRGAMGVVFKARQLSMDRIVAIKFLPKKLAQDERIVARFLREARAAGQLAHPNIVSVHELGIADGLHFIAMEYVDGNSIQKRLKEKGPFGEKETLEITLQIAEALRLAHSRGILHRDIKPDNFLIDSAGRVRLADLGLALIQSNPDAGLTQDGTTLGTPHFMSPEQCSGTNVDARSDLYSLGASMFVMATGRTPFEGTTAAAVMVRVLTEHPLSVKKVRPELTSGFVALIEKMMSKEPAKRFQDAQSAIEAIQQCKSGLYKAVVAQKPLAPNKNPGQAKSAQGKPTASPAQNQAGASEKPGTKPLRPNSSKVIPLLLGAGAALVLLTVLFLMSRGKTSTSKEQETALTLTKEQQTTGTASTTPGKPAVNEMSQAVIGLKQPDDVPLRHKFLRKQLLDLRDDMKSDKIKFAAAQRRLNDILKDLEKNDRTGAVFNEHRMLIKTVQKEIDAKQIIATEEWKKLEGKVNADLKEGHIGDALVKLSDFLTANEGSEEAAKAGDRIDALCSGVLARADKMASAGNFKDARAQLASMPAKLPEKQDTLFKAAVAAYDERIRHGQDLVECYDRAVKKTLYYDPISKTCFQFSEGVKVCTEYASRARDEYARKDFLELAEYFKSAETIFASTRMQVNAKPLELATFSGMNGVTIRQWDDHALTFNARDFPQLQTFYWDNKPTVPETALQVARELKKSELIDKPAAQWEYGLLAFALGSRIGAGKYLRDAVAGDDSPYKSQASVALALTKSAEPAVAKVDRTEKPDAPPAVPNPSAIEDDARQLFKDLQDAKKADNKEKVKLIRADFETKYAAAEFTKSHKKEIDELTGTASVAAVEPAKTPDPAKPVDKPKVDTLPPEEKEAHELLKKMGWTEIIGTWIWDKEKQAFRVEGTSELVNAATECDVSLQFRLVDSTSKIRVLTRVEKSAVVDRFAGFGGKTSLGFGADINSDHVYLYLDHKKGASKDPVPYMDWKLESHQFHTAELSFHGIKLSVAVDSIEKHTAGGEARASGDTRIIVSGPALLRMPRITNAK